LRCATAQTIVVGRLGRFDAQPGFYVYVGSAFGAGGLAARLGHHLGPARTLHWHIDYLRQAASIDEVWYACQDQRREHSWAQAMAAMPGAAIPLPGFGASDCTCPAHLFRFASAPSFSSFQQAVDMPCQRWTEAAARYAAWQREETCPFTGWDFSHLAGRMIEEKPPWDYLAQAAELMRRSSSVLDLGTGGGERLLSLRDSWPAKVAVTEEYLPNFRLVGQRLGPLGVIVKHAPADAIHSLPFADGEFDLVLNRHSGFGGAEVARVLAPGGVFLTQQVHGQSGQDLQAAFGARPQWPWATPEYFGGSLRDAGLKIVACREWTGKELFTDVGAIVYYLKAVPWMAPGFSVKRHLLALVGLQGQLERGGPLSFGIGRYLIEAHKPAA
jgi:Uri superfamily endonuclease